MVGGENSWYIADVNRQKGQWIYYDPNLTKSSVLFYCRYHKKLILLQTQKANRIYMCDQDRHSNITVLLKVLQVNNVISTSKSVYFM